MKRQKSLVSKEIPKEETRIRFNALTFSSYDLWDKNDNSIMQEMERRTTYECM